MSRRKDGRPRVSVHLGLDPLPYESVAPEGKQIKGRTRWASLTEGHAWWNDTRVLKPREGYEQDEEAYS